MDRPLTSEGTFAALELALPAERGAVSLVSDLVERFLRARLGLQEYADCGRELLLVLQEALSNVIRHGIGEAAGTMSIAVRVDEERIRMSFGDIGPGFHPEEVPSPTLQQPKVGGYGIYLMRNLMDRVQVCCEEGTHELLLELRRPVVGAPS